MTSIQGADELARSMREGLLEWLERNQWKGFDPFDGLTSPWAKPFIDGFMSQLPGASIFRLAILQAVKRSPMDLRKILGVRPQENAMSWAVGALGALEASKRESTQREQIRTRVTKMLDHRSPQTFLWGYPFPWQARAFYVPARSPNLVISAVCLRALVAGIQLEPSFPETAAWKKSLFESLESLDTKFWRSEKDYFSYVEDRAVLVHNANLFGAEVFFSSALSEKSIDLTNAIEAIKTSLAAQEKSGRWSYGTSPHHAWADNFHTAYNLVSLSRIWECCRVLGFSELQSAVGEAIRRGLAYYLKNAFTETGSCRYYDSHTFPLETHSVAASLICLKELSQSGFIDRAEASRHSANVLKAAERDLYLGQGQFAYRKWSQKQVQTVFTRWTQSWMYWGIECALDLIPNSKEASITSSSTQKDTSPVYVQAKPQL